jgi:hypothetical protein
MAIVQTQCTVFKQNVLSALENFAVGTSYTYKIALYTANANLGAATLTYTTDNEVVGDGYTAGGETLTIIPPASSGSTAYVSFDTVTWDPASFTCRGALIYNSTTGAAVAVLNFGADKTASPEIGFTITFPTADANNAIIRYS